MRVSAQVIDELVDEKLLIIIDKHMQQLGLPCAGSTCDVWSLKSCSESYACLRGSFVLDGDMLASVTGNAEYQGKLKDMSPILEFARFKNKHHTGQTLSDWKKAALAKYRMGKAVGLATAGRCIKQQKGQPHLGAGHEGV